MIRKKMLKTILIIVGSVSLALGILGIFLPLLPTTPFLILSAFCYSKGSDAFHKWLLHHPRLGPPIHDWEKSGVIRKPTKILATCMLLMSACFVFGYKFIFPERNIPEVGKFAFLAIAISVLIFIWTRPSRPKR